MRNKKAKYLRKDVMLKMYAGDDVTEADVRKGKHDIMKEPEFKKVFRSRKKNSMRKEQPVKHMLLPLSAKEKTELKIMHDIRVKKQKQRSMEIKNRKTK